MRSYDLDPLLLLPLKKLSPFFSLPVCRLSSLVWGWSQTRRQRESLVLYRAFNTFWLVAFCVPARWHSNHQKEDNTVLRWWVKIPKKAKNNKTTKLLSKVFISDFVSVNFFSVKKYAVLFKKIINYCTMYVRRTYLFNCSYGISKREKNSHAPLVREKRSE